MNNDTEQFNWHTDDLATRLEALGIGHNAMQLIIRGYTVIEDAAPLEFFDRLRARLLKCFEKAGTSVVVGMLLKEGRCFEEAVCNPKLVALAEFLCGKGFLLSQVVGTVRTKGEKGLAIHTDYNLIRDPFPIFSQVATAVWVCDDFTEQGGCTRLVPASHQLRRHPIQERGEGEDQAIPVECKRGSIILWDGATWHGSYPRRTGGSRVALHIMFNRMVLRTFETYHLSEKIIKRNPEVFASMLGMNDPFGKSDIAGANLSLTQRAKRIFRT